jgi:Predicted transcriptional regulators
VYTVKADYFKALAHPARIRILELLRQGERTVGELVADLELEQSNVSQQLGILRAKGIIESRRDGSSVRCRVKDPRVFKLLAVAKDIIVSALTESQNLLADLDQPEFTTAGSKAKRR